MIGWSTVRDTEKAMSSYTVPSQDNVTLYAVYVECDKGEYTSDNGTECWTCPGDYVDGPAAANINGCMMKVPGGEYVETENDLNAKSCGTGKWRESHNVYYGQKSYCNTCPTYYQEGAATDAKSKCVNKVSCGYKVGSANAQESKCGKGSYSGAHEVKYGKTSSCTDASKGYYVDSEGSCSQTKCACGHYTDATGKSSCSACTAGHYASGEGNTGCSDAGSGYYVSSNGACSRSGCPSGFGSTGSTTSTAATSCYHGATANKTKTTKKCNCNTSCTHAVKKCEYGEWKLTNIKPNTCYNTTHACASNGNDNGALIEECNCTTSCSFGGTSSSTVAASDCSSSGWSSCDSDHGDKTHVSCSSTWYSCSSGSLDGDKCYYSG